MGATSLAKSRGAARLQRVNSIRRTGTRTGALTYSSSSSCGDRVAGRILPRTPRVQMAGVRLLLIARLPGGGGPTFPQAIPARSRFISAAAPLFGREAQAGASTSPPEKHFSKVGACLLCVKVDAWGAARGEADNKGSDNKLRCAVSGEEATLPEIDM
uniref:Uncharacterized protein n=1 Tax=Steinernema glaseri TaxID=37863 RepID=A0A1I8A2U5_9BILA